MNEEEKRIKWRESKRKYRETMGHPPKNKQNDKGQLKCGKCGEYKSKPEFYKDSKSVRGVTSYCKICAKNAAIERYYSGNA